MRWMVKVRETTASTLTPRFVLTYRINSSSSASSSSVVISSRSSFSFCNRWYVSKYITICSCQCQSTFSATPSRLQRKSSNHLRPQPIKAFQVHWTKSHKVLTWLSPISTFTKRLTTATATASWHTFFPSNSSTITLLRLCNLLKLLIFSWSSFVTSLSVVSDSSSLDNYDWLAGVSFLFPDGHVFVFSGVHWYGRLDGRRMVVELLGRGWYVRRGGITWLMCPVDRELIPKGVECEDVTKSCGIGVYDCCVIDWVLGDGVGLSKN